MNYKQTNGGILVPANFAASSKPEILEVATTLNGRDVTRGYLDPLQIQQPVDSVLELRGNFDYGIYKELLRDDQIGSTFQQRRLAVISKEWDVEPGGKSKKDKAAAESLKEQLNNAGWDRVTDGMLYGIYYGFAVAECMWAKDNRHVVIDDIKVRERRRFGFDGAGRLRLKTLSDAVGEIMPEKKFWAFNTGADNDDEPYGLGLAHWLYWPAFFKRNGLQYWLIFLERFGQPTTLGKYPVNATPEERTKLLNALDAIATDTGITIPQGMEVSLLEAARSGTADYSGLYDKMDAAIAKITLGQTASTQGTPGKLGNDELQGDVRNDLVKADADLVCESFNRTVARWLTDWNYPGAAYPRVYRKVELDEDLAKRAERDSSIVGMGFKPTTGYITETYGGDWVEAPAATPAAFPRVPDFAAHDKRTPYSLQVLNATRQQIQPVTDNWINQIKNVVENAESLDELPSKIMALKPSLSLDEYADALATATAAAQLAGRTEVQEGS